MKKSKEETIVLPPPPILWPQYTAKELDEFEAFLEKFKEEKEVWTFRMIEEKVLDADGKEKLDKDGKPIMEETRVSEKKSVSIINLDDAMVEFGAMVKKFTNGIPYYAVLVKVNKLDIHNRAIGYEYPNKYMLFNHKRQALFDRNFKKNYASEKQLESYQQMMDGMDIDVVKLFPKEEKNENSN